MFRSAATRLAHNSTLPSLNITGNKDLKPLQDLITAEKNVLTSLQRLNVDLNRASEALRIWGSGEGDDLADILNASSILLGQYSGSLLTYATHEQVIRDHMKAVRTREEALDELKRRRKSVGIKADTAEKKLQKMSSEHKNLPSQTDLLNRLRDEMRSLDGEIMNEEANLGDFKRETTREWMALKFCGLEEMCIKGQITGDVGRQIIQEIPLHRTQPGLPRSMYSGQLRVQELMSQAQQQASEVQYNAPAHANDQHLPGPSADPSAPAQYSYGVDGLSSSYMQPPPQSQSPTAEQRQFNPPRSTVDDFGVNLHTNSGFGPVDMNALGGRFATFPVRPTQGNSSFSAVQDQTQEPPTLSQGPSDDSESFSTSVAAALHYADQPPSPSSNERAPTYNPPPRLSLGDSAPAYEAPGNNRSGPIAPLPPGAGLANPWGQDAARSRSPDDHAGLSYLEDESSEANRISRHVRFGGVPDTPQTPAFHATKEEAYDHSTAAPAIQYSSAPSLDEERQMNAAAARDVGREMDHYSYSPPKFPEPEPHPDYNPPQTDHQQVDDNRPRPPPSPLEPPHRPFADATTSSRISGDVAPSTDLSSPYDANALEARRDSYDDTPVPQSPVNYAPSPLSTSFNNINYPPPSYPPPQTSTPGSPTASNTPYGTPLESPRVFPANKSTTSLTAPPAGARTISAAAFRRPQARHTSFGSADAPAPGSPNMSLDNGRRRLPTSPLDGRDRNSLAGSYSAPGSNEPQDYIGVYPGESTAESPGSPKLPDYGTLGHVRVTNTSATSPG